MDKKQLENLREGCSENSGRDMKETDNEMEEIARKQGGTCCPVSSHADS